MQVQKALRSARQFIRPLMVDQVADVLISEQCELNDQINI